MKAGGAMKLESAKSLDIKASGSMTLKGAKVGIN